MNSKAQMALLEISERPLPLLAPSKSFLILRKALRHDFSRAEAKTILESDPLLAFYLLRAANNPPLGFPQRATSIEDALAIVGVNNLQQIFSEEALHKTMIEKNNVWDNLNGHSMGVAFAARAIAQRTAPQLAEKIYTAGLLHDVGRYLIKLALPLEAGMVRRKTMADADHRLLLFEKDVLDITHAEFGYMLSQDFNLPDFIGACMRYHHFLPRGVDHAEDIAFISLGEIIAKGMELGATEDFYADPVSREMWAHLRKLRTEEYYPLIKKIQNDFSEKQAYLDYLFYSS